MGFVMDFKEVFISLSIRIVLLTFTHSNQILQKYHNCNASDIIDHITFADNHKCLQIILNFDSQLNCAFLQSFNSIPFQVRSFASLQSRNIIFEQYVQCETFLIFTENWETAQQLLVNYMQNETTTKPRPKQFFPFSYIYFHLSESNKYPDGDLIRKYLHENAIFGFFFEYVENNSTSEYRVHNLLGYDVDGIIDSIIPKDLLHPMVNTRMPKVENFRISLFEYPPYNFYSKFENNDT